MKSFCIACLLLLTTCVPRLVVAQSINATISGLILDPTGRVIPGAAIAILNEATGLQYSGKTNATGLFTVSALPPGRYRIQASKMGFKTLIKPGVVLNVQSAVAVNFTLPLGATFESITIGSGADMINTTDASVSTVIDRKFVENMPLNGRSFQDLISMTPGVVTQSPQAASNLAINGDFSVNGQRTESNNYTVDGVTGNVASGNGFGTTGPGVGGQLGASTALGTTQSLVSVDALQEFRVQSSSYSAEYGTSPGGQFSLATRSGTNAFHGGVFEYLRNNYFDANDWFNDFYGKPIAALRQNDFGGTLGGPVWIPRLYAGRDRTFFFLSYEGLRLTQPTAAVIQYVPDTFMRQQASAAVQPILSAFPQQNGHDFGTATAPSLAQFIEPYALPSQINSTTARIDHIVAPHLSLFFRYGDTPSSTSSRPYFSLVYSRMNVQTFTFGATVRFLDRDSNDLRLGYDRADALTKGIVNNFGGAVPIDLAAAMGGSSFASPYPAVIFNFPGIGYSDFAVPNSSNRGRQWNLVDTFNIIAGHHDLKFGINYRRIKSPITPGNPEMIAEYLSSHSILNNSADLTEVETQVSSTPIFNETALFAQDEWHVSPRLNLSLGLRWDLDPPPTEQHGNDAFTLTGSISNPATLAVAPRGTSLWKTSRFNIAPRLGVVWTANKRAHRETVVRTGGGVFFDTLNQVAAQGYGGLGFTAYQIYAGTPLPFTSTQLNVPLSTSAPYTSDYIYAFPGHLQQPYTLQWNVGVQQSLGINQTLTLTYVGANGRRLIGEQEISLSKFNPNFGYVVYFPGGITSNYQALQTQFQRSVTRGIQALASYTWSHSIDYGSTSTALPLTRASSDFDVRQNLQGGLSWELPKANGNRPTTALLNGWALDGRLMVRTGFPVPLTGTAYFNPSTGGLAYGGLNLVANQPAYLYGSQYPGGRVINKAAFSIPASNSAGNTPRNMIRGFGATEVNVAARREFTLHEGIGLLFRAEAFNIFNHPNFGYIDPTFSDATFGQATKMLNSSLGTMASQYQQGGPRSMQFALKIHF